MNRPRTICRYLSVMAALLSLASCSDILESGHAPAGGEQQVTFSVEIPDPIEVNTRSVDPDGRGIETLRLWCFDANGIFVSTATADITRVEDDGVGYKGTFSASLPDNTNIVHLIANQVMDESGEGNFYGRIEQEVIGELVASSDRMVYWGRVEAGEGSISDALKKGTLHKGGNTDGVNYLVRNQAKITVAENTYFEVTGFAVVNSSAFGTVAPYNESTKKFDFIDSGPEYYVTIPEDEGRTTAPDDVSARSEQYVFESYNKISDPVSLIVKGHNKSEEEDAKDTYHRILFLDDSGDPIEIIRHHWYKVNITNNLKYGYSSVEEALDGIAENNVFLSISDEINSVSDNSHVLTVDETHIVICKDDVGENRELVIKFTYTDAKGNGVTGDAPTADWVTWVSNEVATNSFDFSYDPATGEGAITITLKELGDATELAGSLLIKESSGKLQRTVSVKLIERLSFVPVWASENVSNTSASNKVTLMFTIPDDTPEELFPLRILISAEDVDIRNASGMTLDVVTEEMCVLYNYCWGEENSIGYKYVYYAEAPGVQRVYFATTQSDITSGTIYIENEYFTMAETKYTASSGSNYIGLTNVGEYNGITGSAIADDEDVIYYRLVPPKVKALCQFQVGIYSDEERTEAVSDGVQDGDEFLIYTRYLEPVTLDENETEITDPDTEKTFTREANVVEVTAAEGDIAGTRWGFYPRTGISRDDNKLKVYLWTNTPMTSAGVVRIASNPTGNASLTGNGTYSGNQYRSITFELAPYEPFKFLSALAVNNDTANDTKSQEWTYELGQAVDVEFDVTSYTHTYNGESTEVNPFGTKFKVFIDAPMLEISSKNTLSSDKFYQDADGRFVYVVDEKRATELESAASEQTTSQSGSEKKERKVLHFKTSKICSAGSITISAEPEVVIFDSETYKISNSPITGTIKYGDSEASATAILAGEFVSFARTRDDTRIGSLVIGDSGSYELTLKSEYTYGWDGDESVTFEYKVSDTDSSITYYTATVTNLATLFKNGDVTLVKQE